MSPQISSNHIDAGGLQGFNNININELIARLLNLSGNQLDAVLPSTPYGSNRLPLALDLRVLAVEPWAGGARCTLTWTYDTRLIPLIDRFEVYAYSYNGFEDVYNKANYLLAGPVSCLTPPIALFINVPSQKTVVFEIKPIFKSGLTNPMQANATVSTVVNAPVLASDYKMTRVNTLSQAAGVAVLAAGVANNIPCSEIQTTDYIVCIPVILGGTPGTVTGQNIIANTNFDLISTSATDTSTIFWYVIRLS